MNLSCAVVCLLTVTAVNGLTWTSAPTLPDNATVEACVGQDVTLPWTFQTVPDEHVQTVEWYYSPTGAVEDANFLGIAINNHVQAVQGQTTGLDFLPNAGLQLHNVRPQDSGLYLPHVTVTRNGARITYVQQAHLVVRDASSLAVTTDGQLHAELLSEPVSGSQDVTHMVLACGRFDDYWADKLHVVWTTPDNRTLASTGYDKGRFLLSVPNLAADGQYKYSCSIDDSSPAAACIARGNYASVLQERGSVTVDSLEARLALLQGQLQALLGHQTGDVGALQAQVQELQGQNQQLQHQLHELGLVVDLLRTQNADLEHKLDAAAASVAFHARQAGGVTYATGDVVDYEEVTTNVGGAYNNDTGVFLVPVNGTYAFHVTAVLDYQSPQRANRHLKIMAGDEELCTAVTSFKDHYETGSCQAVAHLAQGQRVYVLSDNDDALFVGGDNTFSGALLHPDLQRAELQPLVG